MDLSYMTFNFVIYMQDFDSHRLVPT